MTKRDLQFQKLYQIAKSEKYETLIVFKLLIWLQKWVPGIQRGNSLVVCRVSPGRKIVVLFWTKYAIPCQIFKLTILRGQSNLSIAFIFVCCKENGYYHAIIVLFRYWTAQFWLPLVLRVQPQPLYARLLKLSYWEINNIPKVPSLNRSHS